MAAPEQNFNVHGMTCAHCVASVTEEVSEIAGVKRVDVDLASGRVVIAGEGFTDEQISAAVEAAGYEIRR